MRTRGAVLQSGERLVDGRTGEVADYRAKGGVERSEIYAPGNALGWAQERQTLWDGAEGAEKRKDAQVARRIEFAGQRELTPEQNWHAAGRFVRQELVRRGMIADLAMQRNQPEPDTWAGRIEQERERDLEPDFDL